MLNMWCYLGDMKIILGNRLIALSIDQSHQGPVISLISHTFFIYLVLGNCGTFYATSKIICILTVSGNFHFTQIQHPCLYQDIAWHFIRDIIKPYFPFYKLKFKNIDVNLTVNHHLPPEGQGVPTSLGPNYVGILSPALVLSALPTQPYLASEHRMAEVQGII